MSACNILPQHSRGHTKSRTYSKAVQSTCLQNSTQKQLSHRHRFDSTELHRGTEVCSSALGAEGSRERHGRVRLEPWLERLRRRLERGQANAQSRCLPAPFLDLPPRPELEAAAAGSGCPLASCTAPNRRPERARGTGRRGHAVGGGRARRGWRQVDHEEVEGLARAGERTAGERLGGGGEGGGGLITRK